MSEPANLEVVMQELGPGGFPHREGEPPSETWTRWCETVRAAWDRRRRREAQSREAT